jgi:SPP1 gp7 family putative phage head morphogenesis protein
VAESDTKKKIIRMLGAQETAWIYHCATKAETLEKKWLRKLKEKFQSEALNTFHSLEKGAEPFVDFVPFLLLHALDVAEAAYAERRAPSISNRLAVDRFPTSYKKIRAWWDDYRKTGKVPSRIQKHADRIKSRYLEKTKDAFEKHSQDFRTGHDHGRQEVIKQIQKAADIEFGRSKMIVRTETTRYYNKVRKQVYDQSNDVTHYLFLAIRDHRTSKWCTEKKTIEGRGRHGLVYEKGDPLTTRETPAVHWNCRSEMVPLTPLNPRHAKLINDKSINRRKVKCTPLPKGWNE